MTNLVREEQETEEFDNRIYELVFTQIAPLFDEITLKQRRGIEHLFLQLLNLFPSVRKFTYKHFIINGEFNLITISPVSKPSKKMLFMVIIFLSAVIHYYLYNGYQRSLCYKTFKDYEKKSEKEFDKYFTIKDSTDIHRQTIQKLQNKLVQQRSLVPIQEKESSWFTLVPKYDHSGLTPEQIDEINKRKKEIKKMENQKEDLQVIIEALGMDTELNIKNTLKGYREKYDSDIEIYKKNLERCMKENSLDKLFLTVYYTVFMIANIYDSSIFQCIISLLPYSEVFLKVKTDRIIVWTLSGIYMKYIGYDYLINDVGKYVFEKGYKLAASGELSDNFLTYIGIFILGMFSIVKILDYIIFKEIPNILLGSGKEITPEKKKEILKDAIEIKKEKRNNNKEIVGSKTPRYRIRKSNKPSVRLSSQSYDKRKFYSELTGNYKKFWSDNQ
jgi:hypothetical protein